MKKFLVVLVLIVVVLYVVSFTRRTAVVTFTKGEAEICLRGKKEWRVLEPGMKLGRNDKIRTKYNSKIDVKIDEKSAFRLTEDSEAQIATLIRMGKFQATSLKLKDGTVLTKVGKYPVKPRFKIRTSAAVAAVRGTSFLVASSPEKTRVAVKEGLIRVGNRKGEVVVGPNQRTEVYPDQAPQPLGALLMQEIRELEEVGRINFRVILKATRAISSIAEIISMEKALDMYHLDHDKYPASVAELISGGYITSKAFQDAWGKSYTYTLSLDGQSYRLASPGPDGITGTRDDLVLAY
ncbi:FecR domain-containing protein [bacterium]|nr:FecR domain-containing protein [bacterium]